MDERGAGEDGEAAPAAGGAAGLPSARGRLTASGLRWCGEAGGSAATHTLTHTYTHAGGVRGGGKRPPPPAHARRAPPWPASSSVAERQCWARTAQAPRKRCAGPGARLPFASRPTAAEARARARESCGGGRAPTPARVAIATRGALRAASLRGASFPPSLPPLIPAPRDSAAASAGSGPSRGLLGAGGPAAPSPLRLTASPRAGCGRHPCTPAAGGSEGEWEARKDEELPGRRRSPPLEGQLGRGKGLAQKKTTKKKHYSAKKSIHLEGTQCKDLQIFLCSHNRWEMVSLQEESKAFEVFASLQE